MKIARLISVCFLLFCTSTLFGNDYKFDFNANCQEAYNDLTALRIEKGRKLLEAEKARDPYNLIPVFLENYEDFLAILIEGDVSDLAKRKKDRKARIQLLNKGDENDPWFRYCKSSVHFQWALINIYNNSNFSAATEFRNSFMLLKQNQKLFPDFVYNNILGGMEEAVVGTIPRNYQWIAKLLGMKGNLRNGERKLKKFIDQNPASDAILKNEAVFYYCYIKFFLEAKHQEVWHYLDQNYKNTSNNLLLTFLKANLALNDNKAALAMRLLRSRNKSSDYLDAPLFDYQMGIAGSRLLDPHTPQYFESFLRKNKGPVFIKSAKERLSLYYVATGNPSLAQSYKQKILTDGGSTFTDVDKQAQRFAEDNSPFLSRGLVAAGLYSDGGEYVKTLEELNKIDPSSLRNRDEKTVYFYRYGKAFQQVGAKANSIAYYKKAIQEGRSSEGQFGARAAVDLGLIYEQQGDKDMAIQCYRESLNMKNKDFKANLEQKAKAGLERLGAS